jgi:signal transduction histidine kinase
MKFETHLHYSSEQSSPWHEALPVFTGMIILSCLYASSLYSYLLFHSLVEIFCVIIIFVIFVLAWNSRHVQDNHYLLYLGIASLFTGIIELLHAFAFKGLGIFPGHDANLPTQLWIAFRYLFSLSLFIAPFFLSRKLNVAWTVIVYCVITSLLLISIFLNVFPDCFVEGRGLTTFKIISEYIITLIFLASLGLMLRKRSAFDRDVLRLMIFSALSAVFAELSFTKYVSVYGFANLAGHLFLLVSVYCIYRAIVVTGIVKPSSLLFRNLKLSEEALKQRTAELESVNRELESFIYSISHDLRAPLRAISGFSIILASKSFERLDPKEKDYLNRICDGTARMSRLIDDLLDLSRISQTEIKRKEVDLSNMASTIFAGLHDAESGRNVAINIQSGMMAQADPSMMEVALSNLLGNAWKFTSKTEKALIEFGTVDAHHPINSPPESGGEQSRQDKTVYYVRDNGAGFDPAFKDKMFLPFHRLHAHDQFEGTGIGLSIVERIIRRHGGKVWAEGAEGHGASIYFTLG